MSSTNENLHVGQFGFYFPFFLLKQRWLSTRVPNWKITLKTSFPRSPFNLHMYQISMQMSSLAQFTLFYFLRFPLLIRSPFVHTIHFTNSPGNFIVIGDLIGFRMRRS